MLRYRFYWILFYVRLYFFIVNDKVGIIVIYSYVEISVFVGILIYSCYFLEKGF